MKNVFWHSIYNVVNNNFGRGRGGGGGGGGVKKKKKKILFINLKNK